MYRVNDDMSIHATRGDVVFLRVAAEHVGIPDKNGELYRFKPGDVVRMSVCAKKNCSNVVMQKDFLVEAETDHVDIILEKYDTKFGNIISKPTVFWYEVELNPDTIPKTIIGYDADGPKVFMLYPEARDITADAH